MDKEAPGGGSGSVQIKRVGVQDCTISPQAAVHPRHMPRALMAVREQNRSRRFCAQKPAVTT